MNATEILLLNLEEIRRRSVIVWRGIPPDRAHWKPDGEAMTCIGMVRHVLEGEFLYTEMLKVRRSVPEDATPFTGRPFTTVDDEIAFSLPFRTTLVRLVQSIGPEELTTLRVDRSDKGYARPVGDFILRMGYHEAVHTGQLLGYLRAMGVARPNIWD
jgi:DinB superfamily